MYANLIEQINKEGYAIIDNIKKDYLNAYMVKNGYQVFIDKLGRQEVSLGVSLYENSLAERTLEGFFHTDFSSHPNPPEYVVIECIKQDPLYPKYGANQIVSVDKLISELKNYNKNIFNIFKNLTFDFNIRNRIVSHNPLLLDDNGLYYMKYHAGYIENYDALDERYFYKGVKIIDVIEELALSICDEIVLATGQTLIFSNKYSLHRRGRCSVDFKNTNNNMNINTFRYIKS